MLSWVLSQMLTVLRWDISKNINSENETSLELILSIPENELSEPRSKSHIPASRIRLSLSN